MQELEQIIQALKEIHLKASGITGQQAHALNHSIAFLSRLNSFLSNMQAFGKDFTYTKKDGGK